MKAALIVIALLTGASVAYGRGNDSGRESLKSNRPVSKGERIKGYSSLLPGPNDDLGQAATRTKPTLSPADARVEPLRPPASVTTQTTVVSSWYRRVWNPSMTVCYQKKGVGACTSDRTP